MSLMPEPLSRVAALRSDGRRAALSWSRAFNASLDSVFYDLGALTADERSLLTAHTRPEGSVVIVPPHGLGRSIEFLTPWQFVQRSRDPSAERVDALAVAGVGSSALGTAALARNVADYLGRSVAGVVSGYGMADLLSEALGGWFVLGARNALRDSIARLFDALELKDHVRDAQTHSEMKTLLESAALDADRFVYGSPDSTTLLYLLLSLGDSLRLLVGHSKGNLSLENALEGLVAARHERSEPVPADLCIVTLGAVTQFPPEFANVHQFIGTVDFFGMLNSRPLVPRQWMPHEWHSLNTALPGHLPVHEALRRAHVR